MEQAYELKITNISFNPQEKFSFIRPDAPVLNKECNIEITFKNVGDNNFPGGVLEMSCYYAKTVNSNTVRLDVSEKDKEIHPIEKEKNLKKVIHATFIGAGSSSTQLRIGAKANNGVIVKFRDELDNSYFQPIDIMSKHEAVEQFKSKWLLRISIATLFFVLLQIFLSN